MILASAASPPTLAQNARVGHPKLRQGKENDVWHGGLCDYPPFRAISTALSTAWALFMASWNSLAGSESATMPAPACKYACLLFISMVRMAMQESRLPAKSA